MNWTVIGATGFVGSGVVDHLAAEGQMVRTMPAPRLSGERDSSPRQLVERARSHPATTAMAAQLHGAEIVVLAAGAATPDARWSSELVGANALLPVAVALAAHRAGVSRLIHISSAAVQGRSTILDETPRVAPCTAYSRSKALGEAGLALCHDTMDTHIVIVRATSVQGANRPTTRRLRHLARSPLASVSGDGSAPSAVSSLAGLCEFIFRVGLYPDPPAIALQPWEKVSTGDVLRLSGGKEPHHLPPMMCRGLVAASYQVSRLLKGRLDGHVRRVEAMWFGQEVRATWASQHGIETTTTALPRLLASTS